MEQRPEASDPDEVGAEPELDELALLRMSIEALEPAVLADPPAATLTPDDGPASPAGSDPHPARAARRRTLALVLMIAGVLVVAAGIVAAAVGHG